MSFNNSLQNIYNLRNKVIKYTSYAMQKLSNLKANSFQNKLMKKKIVIILVFFLESYEKLPQIILRIRNNYLIEKIKYFFIIFSLQILS